MGGHKDDLENASAAWHRKAQYNGYRCSVCGEVIEYDDRELFFARKVCGYHAYVADKDD